MKKFLGFLLIVQALWAAPALAAIEYFLKIPPIEGESTAIGFDKQIVVGSWTWGLTNSSQGTPVFQDFSWTQGVDKSIVPLFLGVARGTNFATATLFVTNTFGGGPAISFFEMVFTNVHLTSLQVSGFGASQSASASMDYETIKMRYRTVDAKGGKGQFIEGTFDTKSSKAAGFSGDAGVVAGLFSAGGSVSLAIVPVTTVPEPITWGMLLAGLMMIGGIVYQRRQTRSEAHGLPQAA